MNIILFWSSQVKDESFDDWIDNKIDLSYLHELSLASQVKYNKDVFLLTYQQFSDKIPVPKEITILDASYYFPAEEAYKIMQSGHSIAHISDLVRLKCAIQKEGVVMDMDAVAINPLPDIPAFMSTHLTKLTGGLVIKFGENHPKFKTDGSWDGKALSVFPFKSCSSISDEVNNLCDKIIKSLNEKPKSGTKSWNYVMWHLKDLANNSDIVHVMKPIECCPIPAWKAAGNCYSLECPSKFDGNSELFGNKLPTMDEIFEKGYIIQHFFESVFKKSEIKENFWENIKEHSLLDKEAQLIFGKNWRQQRGFTPENLNEW